MNTLYLTVPVYDEEDMRRPSCVRMFHCCSTLMLPTPRLNNIWNLISLTTYPFFPRALNSHGKETMAKTMWYCFCMTMAKTVSQRLREHINIGEAGAGWWCDTVTQLIIVTADHKKVSVDVTGLQMMMIQLHLLTHQPVFHVRAAVD